MPIALPAPTAPELGSAETLRGQGGEYVTAAFQQNQVHVHGPDVVSKETLEQAISGAENLSDVVRRVQAAYYLAGYPAVRVVYAMAEPDLYISASLGKVTKVEAPEPYAAYFSGLPGADPLTDEALEPARTFASLHADRAGQSAIPTFQPDGDGSVLRIEPDDKGPGRSSMGAGLGNPGNRFVGRHFADWFVKHSFTTGDELRASGRVGVPKLDDKDEDNGSAGYNEHTLGWGKVTPWGLFALQGRNVNYQQELGPSLLSNVGKYSGNIREAELGWTGLLHASFYSRWGIGAKVDYTRKSFDGIQAESINGDGEPQGRRHEDLIQRQEYGSVELSTQYSLILNPFETPTELSAGVAVRSGLGDNKTDNPVVAADLGYLLFRPTLSARAKLTDWLALRLAAIAQITSDTLPEQQQWVMGGIGNVEAYLPGVAGGDSGGLARFQVEFTSYELAAVKFAPSLFAEYGYAKYESGDNTATQSIADGGVSLAMTAGVFEASVSYAESFHDKNVQKDILDDSEADVFFRVAMKF